MLPKFDNKKGVRCFERRGGKIRESVAYWTATPKRVEKFEETSKQLRIPCKKKLCLDCPTRWNSTFKMFDTTKIYKDVFSQLKHHDPQYSCLPID